jgi:hypothetical protein
MLWYRDAASQRLHRRECYEPDESHAIDYDRECVHGDSPQGRAGESRRRGGRGAPPHGYEPVGFALYGYAAVQVKRCLV